VCASGCERRGAVIGKITFEGKPVSFGSVVMVGVDNQPVQGSIQPDGGYALQGVAYGLVKVAVFSPDPTPASLPDGVVLREGRKVAGSPPRIDPKHWFPLPEKYSNHESSGISLTVEREQTKFDIDLKE
jgi:hypothetical protein